jgi:Uncharacterised nucleotidyltransferase
VNRWQAFIALCSYFRAGLLGGKPPSQGSISWELLIEASSYHYVTPALAWCLKERPEVPLEVRDYLDTILALNHKRNDALLAALTRIVAALNAIDIEPVLLKGAARLAECSYPSPALRFLGDLDVLIPAERSSDAVASLQAIGFRTNPDDPLPPSHHHLPMLHDRETGGGVELHTDLVGRESLEVIPTAWFYAETRPCVLRNLRIRLAEATRSVGHIIVHDQLDHNNNRNRRVQLRQVLDLAMIRGGQESAINWAELDHRFCRMGLGRILATYLVISEALLGQPVPSLRCRPWPDAIEDFRRVIEPPGWVQPWERLMSITAARRRDPRRVLELFAPLKLPGRVIRALKRNSPAW